MTEILILVVVVATLLLLIHHHHAAIGRGPGSATSRLMSSMDTLRLRLETLERHVYGKE